MDITITKKQNVIVDGVRYQAKPTQGYCMGCAFNPHEFDIACDVAPCTKPRRTDNKDVIFIKKESKKAWIPVEGDKPSLSPGLVIHWKNKLGMRSPRGGVFAGYVDWAIGQENEITHFRVAKQ